MRCSYWFAACCLLVLAQDCSAAHPYLSHGKTSLTDKQTKFTTPDRNHVTLHYGGVTAVVVANAAVDTKQLPGHRAGYNGLASLEHEDQPGNAFVPAYAGLNFEHIHDGTTAGLKEKFEPRKFPMQLRVVSDHTVEVYQPPTGNWRLESCGRYTMLKNGVIEYSFECIPRKAAFNNDLIGLFWASYINQPADKSIYFIGKRQGDSAVAPMRALSPKHGVRSTHPPLLKDTSQKKDWANAIKIEDDFPLTLVNHHSEYRYSEPWCYGVNGKMAVVFLFREQDNIWFAQSPTGGGALNPAWDFQWFIQNSQADESYGFTMRLAYLPFENHKQMRNEIEALRKSFSK